MLYLAEVQRKSGFIGSGKVEFRLLACQRGEQDWSAVPSDEVVSAPDDASYNAGALVMVELSNSRQVQRHYDAGRSLVSILQGFSNLNKKFKTQEEEIEQWKQSLTFQSQELNRREMEIEARQEQVEQAESDLEQLETQHQELEQARRALETAQADLEHRNQELEGAWAHLNGENRRLEEKREELSRKSGLDYQQVEKLQEALNRLTGVVTPTESIREKLHEASDVASRHEALLNRHRQNLEQLRAGLEQEFLSLEEHSAGLQRRWSEWRQAEEALAGLKAEARFQQQFVTVKQEHIQALAQELQRQGSLHQQIYDLLNTSDQVRLSKKVDIAALGAMPVDTLQQLVSDLEKDLEKVSRFVSDQEEELTLQHQAIDELKAKIQQANEFDRLELEAEMADEQDRYQMLNETLVGQRRNLLEREEILSQHKAILMRLQGLAVEEPAVGAVDLEPVLDSIDVQRNDTNEAIQSLEAEVKQMHERANGLKQEVEAAASQQLQNREAIRQFEAELEQKRSEVFASQGRTELYGDLLEPLEECLAAFNQTIAAVSESLSHFQEVSDYQLQAISELRQTVISFTDTPAQMASS